MEFHVKYVEYKTRTSILQDRPCEVTFLHVLYMPSAVINKNCKPVGPAMPVPPGGPIFPVAPVAPVGPRIPVWPWRPLTPVLPLGPVAPVAPVGPGGPTTARHNYTVILGRIACLSGNCYKRSSLVCLSVCLCVCLSICLSVGYVLEPYQNG